MYVCVHAAKLKKQAREASETKPEEGEREEEEREREREKEKGKQWVLKRMKQERDYKRRRRKYRAKNAHITRRTPAQVYTCTCTVHQGWPNAAPAML